MSTTLELIESVKGHSFDGFLDRLHITAYEDQNPHLKAIVDLLRHPDSVALELSNEQKLMLIILFQDAHAQEYKKQIHDLLNRMPMAPIALNTREST